MEDAYFCPALTLRAVERSLARGGMLMEDGILQKRCTSCGEYWPADTEFFYGTIKKTTVLHCYCKACYTEKRYGDRKTHESRSAASSEKH